MLHARIGLKSGPSSDSMPLSVCSITWLALLCEHVGNQLQASRPASMSAQIIILAVSPHTAGVSCWSSSGLH